MEENKDPPGSATYLDRRKEPSIRDKVNTILANARVLGKKLDQDADTDAAITLGLMAAILEIHERDAGR